MSYNKCPCNDPPENRPDPDIIREFDCGADKKIIRIRHIIKHRHDIINQYEVIHEHDYHHHDVVTTREIVRNHDHTWYNPNYCGENPGGSSAEVQNDVVVTQG